MAAGFNLDNIEFKGEKRWLSNMHPCSIVMDKALANRYPMFVFDGKKYPSSENLYQVLKTNDLSKRAAFRTMSPLKSKIEGRKLIERADWTSIKVAAMRLCLELKFRNKDLAKKLIATGTEKLEERNDWHDRFWGTYLGEGKNRLGKLLMCKRRELRKGLV